MGDLIALGDRLAERATLGLTGQRPAFYFDLACPFSYLAAERVERLLGEAEWVPAPGGLPPSQDAFAAASERAAALRLPLVWPERFPCFVRGAMRACVYAGDAGAGARFALAAFRLAFCGGYDLERVEVLGELAASVGIPRAACVVAATEVGRDEALSAAARALRRRGVRRLPAFALEGRLFEGERALVAAAALRRHGAAVAHPA